MYWATQPRGVWEEKQAVTFILKVSWQNDQKASAAVRKAEATVRSAEAAKQQHEQYTRAVNSVARLLTRGEPVHFTLQNAAEFWNVLTRSVSGNGLGLTAEIARAELEKIETALTLLPDVPALYPEWRRLVLQYRVQGVKVHDARLVASMNVHNVGRLLTFNSADFTRYGIEVLDPRSRTGLAARLAAPAPAARRRAKNAMPWPSGPWLAGPVRRPAASEHILQRVVQPQFVELNIF